MNRLRRWLAFTLSSKLTPMEPTRITSTVDLLNPDIRRRPFMHLARGEEALCMWSATWQVAGLLARADGHWEPLGTDAKPALLERRGMEPDFDAPAGHYLAAGQMIADADAVALAAGIREAMLHPGPEYIGAQHRGLQLGLFASRANEQLATIPATVASYWHVRESAEQVAAFLNGGACRIMPGLPQKVLDDDKEREALRLKRREAERLEAELANSLESRLARTKAELAAMEAETHV